MAYDAHFTFMLDSKVKKRYFQLSRNGHLHPSFMTTALRNAFNAVIATAEDNSGLMRTVETPTTAADGKPIDAMGPREPRINHSSLKENYLIERKEPQRETSPGPDGA